MSRPVILLVLAATAVAFWLLYAVTADFGLFGWAALAHALNMLAWVATAALAVYVAAQLILQVILAELLEIEPSGLHRGLVFAVLTFAATAALLAHFQFDVSALLTTSAVLSLFVGFATRATLGSLIAGSTLGMDRLLRVGDGLIQGGQPVEIVALNWRSVIGRKADGTTVLIPNGAIAESAMEVVPGDRPVRVETFMTVPAVIPPQRVSAIVDEVLGDLAQIDCAQPIKIAPASFDTDKGFLRYVIRFWVKHFTWRVATENEVMRRLWYAFQREGIASLGANLDEELRRTNERALHHAIEAAAKRRPPERQRALLTTLLEQPKAGQMLLYAPGERIVLPPRFENGLFLLVDGELAEAPSDFQGGGDAPLIEARDDALTHLNRRIALQHIVECLAKRIGPYAEHAVAIEAAHTASLNDVRTALATEIADETEREAFLGETAQTEEVTYKAGSVFAIGEDTLKNVVSKPPMRAVGGAAILAVAADAAGKTAADAATAAA